MNVMAIETELTEPVTLSAHKGSRILRNMNPSAHGWSRRPVVDTELHSGIGAWGRNKRWEYWGIVTPSHIIGFTISSLDYAGVSQLYVIDRATLTMISEDAISPFAHGVTLPNSYAQGPSESLSAHLKLRIDEYQTPGEDPQRISRLRGKSKRLEVDVKAARPLEHEAMHVVVPWSQTRFQYTIKELAIPAQGSITIDGTTHFFGQDDQEKSWAVLDHGRGRWPYSMVWNWAAGSGEVDGVRLGLQLGAKWTDGTGSTENAIVINGVTTKISEELIWEYDSDNWLQPWRIYGETLDVIFTPFYNRVAKTSLLILSGTTHQCFGTWSGWVKDATNAKLRVDGLVGWAEEARNRW